MRIAIAQVNPTVGDLEQNANMIVQCIEEARRSGASLILFPELALSGCPLEGLLVNRQFLADSRYALDVVATACLEIVALVGFPESSEEKVYNSAAVLARGRVQATYRKMRLSNGTSLQDGSQFACGEERLLVQLPDAAVALSIGEDWLKGEAAPADIVADLSMCPYFRGKAREREERLRAYARENGVLVVSVNGVGGQDGLVFDGHSMVIAPDGSVLCRAPQFESALLVVDVEARQGVSDTDRAARTKSQAKLRTVKVDPGQGMPNCLGCGFSGGIEVSEGGVVPLLTEEEEIYRALCLGTRDFVRKNGFERVVFGLSGGMDSALVACIAVDALGAARVVGVSMPSRYTSEGTRNDARLIASNLGIEFLEIPIGKVFHAYLDVLAPFFAGLAADTTEENIQARIRANYLMALSNKFGWLVLTTGNKSETAVGYATLYGDTAGGFAVIKDVPKTLVYRLARYRNERDPEHPPIPISVFERPPSAELRPGQTDQDSLPPYELLDAIVEAYVAEGKSVEDIIACGFDPAVVDQVVRLIHKNEYKRRQGPPGVRISSGAFGVDYRLPVTNRYRPRFLVS